MMNKEFPRNLKMGEQGIYDETILATLPVPDLTRIEMSNEQQSFLYALLKRFRPANLLECGVSAGGSSILLLHALEKLELESQLVSVDLNADWYRDKSRKTGWAAKKLYPDKNNWRLVTGKFLPEVIEELDMEFDFCLLDTVHSLPGELLDFLVVLPFLKEGCVVALHDTMLHLASNSNQFATRILNDVCVGDKIYPPQASLGHANISAFLVTADTCRYAGDVFAALGMRWAYALDEHQYSLYYNYFLKYYGDEAAAWFARAKEWNHANLLASLPAPPRPERTDRELMWLLLRTMLKNILPYGLVSFIKAHRPG